jgi:hypothetical protein
MREFLLIVAAIWLLSLVGLALMYITAGDEEDLWPRN